MSDIKEKTPQKKRTFAPNVRIGGGEPPLSMPVLRSIAKQSPAAFMKRVQSELVDTRVLTLQNIGDLRMLQRALLDVMVPVVVGERSVMSSAFPILLSSLAIAELNAAYEQVPNISDQLVTDIYDPKKVTTIAAVHVLDKDVDRVPETEDYPEISASDESVEIRGLRNGRLLTISQDMIDQNDIANIVELINALVDIASEIQEEQTLKRIFDYDGSAASPAETYVYRPNGTGTQLYNATANNPGTRAPSGTRVNSNALVDYSDLDNARAVLAAMLNSRGKRINIPMSQVQLVVPDALVGLASRILNSEYIPGVENEINSWGPRGRYQPTLVSSPKIDDISTSAWQLGAHKRQFRRKWKLAAEYVTLGSDTESYLRRRTAAQLRIAWDMEIGATDYVFVVQNLSGTTAPKDE